MEGFNKQSDKEIAAKYAKEHDEDLEKVLANQGGVNFIELAELSVAKDSSSGGGVKLLGRIVVRVTHTHTFMRASMSDDGRI